MTMISLIGNKRGMTRLFSQDGRSIPVTVIELLPLSITQIKDIPTDGYKAIQVSYGAVKRNVNKAISGHYSKAEVKIGKGLKEFRVSDVSKYNVGQELSSDLFEKIKFVDVEGISKGKGFAGVVKRYNFRTQDATHGNSLSHRAPGSIGQNQTPGRVFKGKKMAGHLGNVKKTMQNLELVKIDKEKNVVLIKGGIPGSVGSTVLIKPSVKSSNGGSGCN